MDPDDVRLFEDLSRINSELVTLQRELVRKNAELERLNEQKNRFLGMAAHDLRAPLGIIISYGSFLSDEAVLTDEQREFLAAIDEQSRFMLGLINDLLDVTTIEAGRLLLSLSPTDIVAVVGKNVARNNMLARKKSIVVEFHTSLTSTSVPMDAQKIEQVLNNLIGNAVKFSEPGTRVRVRIDAHQAELRVSVEDEGRGIPPSQLKELFQPFSRGKAGTAGEPSTGLGLAIARRIIEGHGGSIGVDSAVPQGSTFWFTLPG